ncbi:MAG: apolipoprotein N-acyltransferase [Prolixibacteraceae bacterium]
MKKSSSLFLACCTGILLSFPWVIPGWSWTLFFALVPLMFAEDRANQEQKQDQILPGYSYGYLSFLIWNLLSTWWISYVSVLGMLLIVGINSLIMAAVWWLRHPVTKKMGTISGYFTLVSFWLTFEFFQHIWALQWPWLTLGNGFANSVKIIQWYEYTGVLGGSIWILLANILIYSAIKSTIRKELYAAAKFSGIALFVLLLPIVISVVSYSGYQEKGSEFGVLVLQPNVDPYTQKFSGISSGEQVKNLISLINESELDSVELILAPETALPDVWEDSVFCNQSGFSPIFDFLNRYPQVSIITGAITKRKFTEGEFISETVRFSEEDSVFYDVFNSAMLFDSTDQIEYCHKSILVSGVEKMPFQRYITFLRNYLLQLGGTSGSLTEGNPMVFTLNNNPVKIGSVICFESAFGEHAAELVKKGASLLVVITNDGWWRKSSGVWQHFGYSRLRAIETRRDIVRSANTGISGFINQRGDVQEMTEINKRTCIRSTAGSNETLTFYVRHGDYLGRIALVFSVLVLLFYFNRR